jgi:hypothetical protein
MTQACAHVVTGAVAPLPAVAAAVTVAAHTPPLPLQPPRSHRLHITPGASAECDRLAGFQTMLRSRAFAMCRPEGKGWRTALSSSLWGGGPWRSHQAVVGVPEVLHQWCPAGWDQMVTGVPEFLGDGGRLSRGPKQQWSSGPELLVLRRWDFQSSGGGTYSCPEAGLLSALRAGWGAMCTCLRLAHQKCYL